jgi:TetR/AcrR family transcriptional regulator, cholesterol catabolism regulator
VKRREQAEWRRERLLDAALEVFVSKGIDRATVKDIAQAAGVTPGLLYPLLRRQGNAAGDAA